MGYAIFTARKLMLRNRINQINFRLMQLSQQQQTLADSAAKMEQAISNTKNIFNTLGNTMQMGMQMQTNAIMQQLANNTANNQGNVDYSQYTPLLQQALSGANFMASPMGQALSIMNQTLDITSQNQLRHIKDMENQIELERKNLETQVKAMSAEMDAVEKAEDNEIKKSAPQFA